MRPRRRSFASWLAAVALFTQAPALPAAGSGPAFASAKQLRRGVNLGNYLEAPRGQNWGASYSAEDFRAIRSEGFDHVRLPVAWHYYAGAGPDYRLEAGIYEKVDALVALALREKLAIIVNLHHFDEFTSDPLRFTNKFYAIWEQLGAHFAASPGAVFLELLNEPKDAATTTLLNPIYAEAIRRIRRANPARTLLLGPGKWNQIDELPRLILPDNDRNLIVTVHCYDPFYFTHQGASWAGPATATVGIVFPGPPSTPLTPASAAAANSNVVKWIERYNSTPAESNPSSPSAFRGKLERARAWALAQDRPVHVGEFGCYQRADPVSRARFYEEFRKALDDFGLGWAMWDWKAGFQYWDESKKAPASGLREALFPGKR